MRVYNGVHTNIINWPNLHRHNINLEGLWINKRGPTASRWVEEVIRPAAA